MILELHLIQNFAPSNLNRNDTGAPKDCVFGGHRRARISSQCFKRAMRDYFRRNFSEQNNLAERSTRLLDEISSHLEAAGKEKQEAIRIVEAALSGVGLSLSAKDATKTQYLLFLGRDEIKRFAEVCLENYDALLSLTPQTADGLSAKEAKKAAKKEFPADIAKALRNIMDGGKAADLALFGRMLADLPDKNRDASSQVAHSISTHKVGVEFDYFTAVDDLKPEDIAGSDHIGTIEFNSACFYRYLNVDTGELGKNLQGDEELTRRTIEAFVRAAVEAIPTGKQNSFATHEKPSFVFAVVREAGMCSLANAFEKPARADREKGLVENSIEKLADYYGKVNGVFGDTAKSKVFVKTSDAAVDGLGIDAGSFSALVEQTVGAIFNRREA